jgi:hypothetical protein
VCSIYLADGDSDANVGVQDPVVQKATGKTDPVDVMGKLREMKNNS